MLRFTYLRIPLLNRREHLFFYLPCSEIRAENATEEKRKERLLKQKPIVMK